MALKLERRILQHMTTTESQTNQSEVETQSPKSPRILTPPINKYTYEVYVDGLCHAINLFVSYTKSDRYMENDLGKHNQFDSQLVRTALQIKENIHNIPTSVLCYCYGFENLNNKYHAPIQRLNLHLFNDLCVRNDLLLSTQEIFDNAKILSGFHYDKSRYTTIQNIINGLYVEEPDLKEGELKEFEMFEM